MIKYMFSLAIIFSGSLCAAQIQGNVIRVLDGDTLEILQDKKTVRVRLANIDAPEKKQPFGRWSASQLKDLVAGKPVTVQYLQTDRYNRILGRVYTADGTEANREQIRKGAAWVYPDYNKDYTLPALQRDARALKRGLWADENPVPPWAWRKQNKKQSFTDMKQKNISKQINGKNTVWEKIAIFTAALFLIFAVCWS